MEKYLSIRDTGVEGIGILPASWETKSFSKVNRIRARLGWKGLKAEEYVDEGYPFLSAFNLVNNRLVWEPLNYITQERYDESPEIKLSVGDILLVKDGAGIGKVARIDELPLGESTVNSSLAVITSKSGLDYKFSYFFLLSPLFSNIVTRLRNGMGVPHLTQEAMKEIKMPFPSIAEQRAIAAYLDNQVTQIDSIIAEARANIEEYKQFRAATIEETTLGYALPVTKKKSGIEWIDEIPVTWQALRLKSLFSFGKGLPITKDNLVENGTAVISYGQIHAKFNRGTEIVEGLIRYVPESYIETNPESLVHKGDILVADTSEDTDGCGNAVYVDRDMQLFAGYHTIILRDIIGRNNKYLAYLFRTNAWRSQIRSRVSGVKLFSISKKLLNMATVILPPEEDQQEIIRKLDKICREIDEIITGKEELISDLEIYKRSLIYEAVTGKRKVV